MNTIGVHCPVGLPTQDGTYLVRLSRWWDRDNFERGERINGYAQCPKCGLWWPCIEEPDAWTEEREGSNKWIATGWWGAAVCEECGLLMADQPDGTPETYVLR